MLVKHWSSVSNEGRNPPFSEGLKNRLGSRLFLVLPRGRGRDRSSPEVPPAFLFFCFLQDNESHRQFANVRAIVWPGKCRPVILALIFRKVSEQIINRFVGN